MAAPLQGRPIYIQHLGQINVKALNELTSEERMVKFHVQVPASPPAGSSLCRV